MRLFLPPALWWRTTRLGEVKQLKWQPPRAPDNILLTKTTSAPKQLLSPACPRPSVGLAEPHRGSPAIMTRWKGSLSPSHWDFQSRDEKVWLKGTSFLCLAGEFLWNSLWNITPLALLTRLGRESAMLTNAHGQGGLFSGVGAQPGTE